MRRRSLLVLSLLLAAPAVLVASPRGVEAQALVDRQYNVDVIDLPVLGSSRAVGLGGAYASAGAGTSAMGWNPAATATRVPWDDDWFEWEVEFGLLFPSSGNANRFFGDTGDGVAVDGFQYYDAGLRFQFGPAAVGALFRPRVFTVGDQDVSSQIGHVDAAWSFFDGELVVGAGVHVVRLAIERDGKALFETLGANAEAGATVAPHELPFRAALAVRAPIHSRAASGSGAVPGLALPASVIVPWEVTASGTLGFGERRLNVPPPRLERPRARRRREQFERRSALAIADAADAIPSESAEPDEFDQDEPPAPRRVRRPRRQRYGLVTADLVIQGPIAQGVGLDGFLTQTERRWGRRTTVSPRVGIEGEPWRNRLTLRGGVYREPARSDLAHPRLHFTQGFDLRLFSTRVFGLFDDPIHVKVTWVSDFAKQYTNVGFGVGLWH